VRSHEISHVGSAYGGWDVALGLIPSGATVISCGVGNDFSFSQLLIEQRNCFIVMVDPNSVAIATVAASGLPASNYKHVMAALWTNDHGVDFGAELSNGAGIFSRGRMLHLGSISLKSLLTEYPHTALLKMDVEGAEYEVLEQYDFAIRPVQIAVGFHFKKRPEKNYDLILDRMRSLGYTVRYKRQEDQSEMVVLLTRLP